MAIWSRLRKDEVQGTRVLICALGHQFDDLMQTDASVYQKYYPAIKSDRYDSIPDLLQGIAWGFDVIHLFCNVDPEGMVTDDKGNTMTGSDLIQTCCTSDVKLLWIAQANLPEGYIRSFGARRKRLNLVMTVTRNGERFTKFLEGLLLQMSSGATMPKAWTELVPQSPSSIRADVPGCIFVAGRGRVVLQ